MPPEEDFAVYEALLARALKYADGLGERGPMRAAPSERWLSRWDSGLRLHWLDDSVSEGLDDRSMPVPMEVFGIAEDEFDAWVLVHRLEREQRQASNRDIYSGMVKRFFEKRDKG